MPVKLLFKTAPVLMLSLIFMSDSYDIHIDFALKISVRKFLRTY